MRIDFKKATPVLLLSAALIFVAFVSPVRSGSAPCLNHGKKWRIGYYEGGGYSDYTETMRTLIDGLIELGWIEDKDPPVLSGELRKPYWDWLACCQSPYLSFRPQDAYSAAWDEDRRSENRKAMMENLKAKELDLVLAMGTWAGQDLANVEHSVPTMVLSTSDPVKAGIVASAEDSGLEHVTARVDPNRYVRQIRMFHRIVGFETLGVAYENSPVGKVYAALDDVRRIADERGFQVATCEVIDSTSDAEKADQSCMKCFRTLAEQADAVYVTALTCVDRQVEKLAEILRDARVPSFAMVGSRFVEKGVMLSISSDSGYAGLGKYNAKKFGEILNGAKPGDLNQVSEDPLSIAVNMETVRRIGFEMPPGLLSVASEIYDK